ncbi:hypothetical protein [Pedobacter sp. SG908]|uniref:hypothetical protein n=1 Tax=Pedobacter sp. SG908 TaxID=2587135 RepID=UPI001423954F|nr:hypothetical protein [Pedobacter sp. SG908]NII85673.1 hypothetical protein [Pedobacter sp. SG908]
MRSYCLTYDAKDSKKYQNDSDFYRRIITETLIEAGCSDFFMPVATTIIFSYESHNISTLNSLIESELSKHMYYHLSLIAITTNGDNYVKGNPDKNLSKNFDEFVKSL